MDSREIKLWNKIHYPVTILNDRYYGCYSGAEWLAFPLDREDVPEDVCGEDEEEMWFWDNFKGIVGKGNTPDSSYKDLLEKMANAV